MKYTATEEKYRKFVQEYLTNGLNGRHAYQAVYHKSNDNSSDVGASRLLKNSKVQEFMEEFKNLPENNKLSKAEIVQNIIDTRDEAFRNKRYTDVLRANEILTKMFGFYEPDKQEISGNIKFDFGNDLDGE